MERDMTGKWKVNAAAVFLCALALGLAAPAASLPLSGATTLKNSGDGMVASVAHRKRPRSGWAHSGAPRVLHAAPGPAPGCPWLKSWNPTNPDRGYCDPGFSYHGNINGCVVDQGYGRWISCDSMER
jgi:hypothetical protein